jgi:hypothetical protein
LVLLESISTERKTGELKKRMRKESSRRNEGVSQHATRSTTLKAQILEDY